jgi:hypothetical protein
MMGGEKGKTTHLGKPKQRNLVVLPQARVNNLIDATAQQGTRPCQAPQPPLLGT